MLALTNNSSIVYSPSGRFGICEGINEKKQFSGNCCNFILADLKNGKKFEIRLRNDFEWLPCSLYDDDDDLNDQIGYFSHRVHDVYWLSDKYLVVCYVNRIFREDELHILYNFNNTKRNKEIEPIAKERIFRVDSKIDGKQTLGANYLTIDQKVYSQFVLPNSKSIIFKRIWNLIRRLLHVL